MPSTFAWIDSTESERKRMLDFISHFREQDTVDELGIGTIRDAVADLLFPGTSTIQTRLKYVLFVPWIYLSLEKKRVPSAEIRHAAQREETSLGKALMTGAETDGVIGRRAGASLKVYPSSIYWAALATWGIRRFDGSQEQYHRYLDGYYAANRQRAYGDDGDPVEPVCSPNWDPAIPARPFDLLAHSDFRVHRDQATYLSERITRSCPRSLLSFLIERGLRCDGAEMIWAHPQLADFPDRLRLQVDHARNFSEIMHGPALMYNLLLSQKRQDEELVDRYQSQLDDWANKVESRMTVLQHWNVGEFWQIAGSEGARIPDKARKFVERWIAMVLASSSLPEVWRQDSVRSLITSREFEIKGGRARLQNQRRLELWSGASGTSALSFRWPVARSFVDDIIAGLGQEDQLARS